MSGHELPTPSGAQLGLASTRELLAEIAARMRITQNSTAGRDLGRTCQEAIRNLAPSVLAYSTVGGWDLPTPPTEPGVPTEDDEAGAS